MKRVLWVAAFLGVSTVFTAGQSGPAVAVRLRFAKNHYSIRDRIELEIVRENISNDPLLLSSLWFWGVMRTDIHVFDKARHEIRTGVLADSVPYPPKPYDFVVLGPTFLGIPSLSDEQVTSFPTERGTLPARVYTFVATDLGRVCRTAVISQPLKRRRHPNAS